jgi:hypothetical protein
MYLTQSEAATCAHLHDRALTQSYSALSSRLLAALLTLYMLVALQLNL